MNLVSKLSQKTVFQKIMSTDWDTFKTSPFGVFPSAISERTDLLSTTFPDARALRCVIARSDTSTIWASPSSLMWLNLSFICES